MEEQKINDARVDLEPRRQTSEVIVDLHMRRTCEDLLIGENDTQRVEAPDVAAEGHLQLIPTQSLELGGQTLTAMTPLNNRSRLLINDTDHICGSSDPRLHKSGQGSSARENIRSERDSYYLKQCRFCFQDEQSESNPLLSPCECTGSLSVIHYICLKTWLARKEVVRVSGDDQVITYSWKAFHCELCKSKYQESLPNPMSPDQRIQLFEISKPQSNYIVLESFISEASGVNAPNAAAEQSQTWQKNLHVINFNKDALSDEQLSQVTIGRGTDNDLRVTDISVSRLHAFIKRSQSGDYFITDNSSKFGTLVQLQTPMLLSDKYAYNFQAGRSCFKV